MKFFTRNEMGQLYLFETEHSHLMFDTEWRQLLHYGEFNWVTFHPFHLELDYMKVFWNHFSIDLVLLGFGLYFQLSTATDEQRDSAEEGREKLMKEIGVRDEMETLARALALRAAGDPLSEPTLAKAREIVEVLDRGVNIVDMTEATGSSVKLKDII